MRIFGYSSLLIIIMFIFGQSCSIQTAPFPEIKAVPNVTYTSHIEPIIKANCVKCHNDFNYDRLVYLKYSLWTKIVVDKSMPYGMIMSDQKRALIRDWINQGMKK